MLTAETNTVVTLSADGWRKAVEMGTKRHEMAEARGYRQTDGSKSRNGLANHIRGAGAEIAVAKLYEVEWDATINGFRRIPDLLGCEIRSTASSNPYLRIKLTDKTKASWPFISVISLGGQDYQIEGWFYGYEGMSHKYFVQIDKHSRKPEWHVPIRDLHPAFTFQSVLWKLRDLKKDVARQEVTTSGGEQYALS